MGGRQPLSSIANIEALQTEAEKVISMVRSIQESIDSVNKVGDNYKKSSGTAAAKKDVDELAAANEKLLQSQKLLAAEKQKAITLESELAKQIAVLKTQNQKNSDDSVSAIKKLQQELDQLTASYKKLSETQKSGGSNKPKTDEEIRASIKQREETQARINAVKAEMSAYKGLSVEKEKQAQVAKDLQAKSLQNPTDPALKAQAAEAAAAANQLNTQLKNIDASIGDHKRKVGDYIGAVSILDKTLQETNSQIGRFGQAQQQAAQKSASLMQELSQLTNSGQQNSKMWLQIKAEIDQLNKSEQVAAEQQAKLSQQSELLNALLSQQARGFTSVTMEIRANERALFSLKEAGLKDSQAFKELQISVAAAHRELNEFNKGQKILESTDPALKAATISAKGLAGAYALGAGASALLADGDEKVQKELNKLVAVMTIMQGLQEVSELLHQRNAIALAFETSMTRVGAFANRIWTSTMLQSTVATLGFRAALITLTGGLLLLIPLLAFATDKFSDFAAKQAEAAEEQRLTNEVLEESGKEYAKAVQEVENLRQHIDLAKKGFIEKKDVVKEYNDTIGKTTGEIEDLDQAEKELEKNADAYIQFTLLKAAANIALGKAADAAFEAELERSKPLDTASSKALSGVFGADEEETKKDLEVQKKSIIKAGEEKKGTLTEVAKKLNEAAAALAKKYHFNFFGDDNKGDSDKAKKEIDDGYAKLLEARQKYAEKVKQIKIDELNTTGENKDAPERQRIADLQQASILEKEILESRAETALKIKDAEAQRNKANLADELADTKKSEYEKTQLKQKAANAEATIAQERKTILLTLEDDLFKNQVLYDSKILQAHADSLAQLAADEKMSHEELLAKEQAYQKAMETLLKSTYQINKNYLDEARDYELQALEDKFAKGLITEEEYNRRKKKIISDALDFTLKAQLKEVEAQKDLARAKNINLPKDQQIDLTQFDASIANIKLKIEENKDAGIIDSNKKVTEQKKQLAEQEINLAKKMEETVSAFILGGYEKKINAIQDQINRNTQLKDIETSRIASSTLDEQQKAAALTVLNAKTQAQNESLAKKQADIKNKEARFEKEKAVFDITAATVQAVAKILLQAAVLSADPLTAPLASNAYAQAAIAGGVGAAEIAAVLAHPVPHYAVGVKSSGDEYAVVGEKGPELMRLPSGEMRMTPATATLTYLQKGTEIIPNDQLDRYMYNNMLQSTAAMLMPKQNDESTKEIRRQSRIIQQQTEELKQAYREVKRPIIRQQFFGDWNAYIKKYID